MLGLHGFPGRFTWRTFNPQQANSAICIITVPKRYEEFMIVPTRAIRTPTGEKQKKYYVFLFFIRGATVK